MFIMSMLGLNFAVPVGAAYVHSSERASYLPCEDE